MIKKCDFTGCDKAGVCRAPKDRYLREYHYFCKEHAAEYNKNWNYYDGMSEDEVEADWERSVFGSASKDKKQAEMDTAEYLKFLDDFIHGRDNFDRRASAPKMPPAVLVAFKTFGLPSATASWKDVRAEYRKLAKKYHPDTSKAKNKKESEKMFRDITSAYTELEKYFKK